MGSLALATILLTAALGASMISVEIGVSVALIELGLDVVCSSILEALELLLDEAALRATLRT